MATTKNHPILQKHKRLGYDILEPKDHILVARFPKRIRALHWINSLFIFALYYLGTMQIIELTSLGQFDTKDNRDIHEILGFIWAFLTISLSLLSWWNIPIFKRKGIVTDKLFIKQKLFTYASIVFAILMGFTGILLFLLQDETAAFLKSILLMLHLLIALAFIPMLIVHLYLAIINKNTRRSLKTMVMSIKVDYISQMPLLGLECALYEKKEPVSLTTSVVDISLKELRVKIKKGKWEKIFKIENMDLAHLQHKDIKSTLKMPIQFYNKKTKHDMVIVTFNYSISILESAKKLLGHAALYKILFLTQRKTPRFNVIENIKIKANEKEHDGTTSSLSVGGFSFHCKEKIEVKSKVEAEFIFDSKKIAYEATILIRRLTVRNTYAYHLSFNEMTDDQYDSLKGHLDDLLIKYGAEIETNYQF